MGYHHLDGNERCLIGALRRLHLSNVQIGKILGRHSSTIGRELKRNCSSSDGKYRSEEADEHARTRKRNGNRRQRFTEEDWVDVIYYITHQYSPEQVVGYLKRLGKKVMSPETIYKALWKDKQAGGNLWLNLRCSNKKRRKHHNTYDSRGRLAGKKMITERPEIANCRGRVGDWEIDTIHGRDKACVVSIVERKTGFLLLGKLTRATADLTNDRTISLLSNVLPLVKSITADNGSEFHGYKQIEARLGYPVYFAAPHHAWERGTNENTNGLVRQYLPKGTSLKNLTQADCDRIASILNNRPRKRLLYHSPSEVFSEALTFALRS